MATSRPSGHARTRNFLALACAATATLLLPGCLTPVEDPSPPSGQTVSFSRDIQPILTSRCADCHQPAGFASFGEISIDLRSGEARASIVNQASGVREGATLVVPGDASASFLFEKVSSDSPREGSRMPLFGAPLSAEELGLLRDWIDQGALDN